MIESVVLTLKRGLNMALKTDEPWLRMTDDATMRVL